MEAVKPLFNVPNGILDVGGITSAARTYPIISYGVDHLMPAH